MSYFYIHIVSERRVVNLLKKTSSSGKTQGCLWEAKNCHMGGRYSSVELGMWISLPFRSDPQKSTI